MALSWKENYATIIKAKTWDESVEGYKITNVLGLAFNYYLAYTKFITGFDVTLDFGIKCEFFFADTYKRGWANETAFTKSKGTELTELKLTIYNYLQSMVGSKKTVATEDITVAEVVVAQVEERQIAIRQDTQERVDLMSVTTGTESRKTNILMWGADGMLFTATNAFAVYAPQVFLNGELVELG